MSTISKFGADPPCFARGTTSPARSHQARSPLRVSAAVPSALALILCAACEYSRENRQTSPNARPAPAAAPAAALCLAAAAANYLQRLLTQNCEPALQAPPAEGGSAFSNPRRAERDGGSGKQLRRGCHHSRKSFPRPGTVAFLGSQGLGRGGLLGEAELGPGRGDMPPPSRRERLLEWRPSPGISRFPWQAGQGHPTRGDLENIPRHLIQERDSIISGCCWGLSSVSFLDCEPFGDREPSLFVCSFIYICVNSFGNLLV
ncbi:translation initiation factor IF-2-like [Hemicordylus capensis]|uniref:translation initiation factor IF-2-like n=1 Tax=Hemicordylus capensis TaxID=884348 RepID=UPI002303DF87|nr:translation initiation factor IF-2-like [Hemicordylus capensis]